MRIRTSLLFLLTGALIIGNVQIAYGNGRTPRRPMYVSPLKAICSNRAGEKLEIFRVGLTVRDVPVDTLFLITAGGFRSRLALKEIKHIKFLTSQIAADGFMEATITRTDEWEERSAKVQVRSGGFMMRLTGFSRSGHSVSIDLSSCQTVEFSRR